MRYAWFVVLAMIVLGAPSWIAADEGTKVMVVLDASGSMWGQIEGRTKIEIAREVIGDLVADLDPGIHLGLVAYGHRREGDCNDIETLVPVGVDTSAAIVRAVNSLKPKGKTPLSEAVRRSAVELGYLKDRATVVLISDGIETCDADPCAVGAELAMSGVDFTAHVIGFAVEETEQAGLRCLAQNTDGLFLSANNAATLKEALDETVKKVKEGPRPIVEEPGEATVDAPDEIPVSGNFDVAWTGPDSRGDYITIVPEGAKEGSYRSYAYTSRGTPSTIQAPDEPGTYEVRYVFGHGNRTLAKETVKVVPVATHLKAPEAVDAGADFAVEWAGPDGRGDYITIVPAGSPEGKYLSYSYTHSGNPAKVRAPDEPGQCEVRYVSGQTQRTLAVVEIKVVAVSASVSAPGSVKAGAEFDVTWKGPDNRGDYVTIAPAGAPDEKYLHYKYTNSGNPAKIMAPEDPGSYEIRYVAGQSRAIMARAPITVEDVTASVSAPPSVKAGTDFSVSWTGPGNRGDYVTIVPAGAPKEKYLSYKYTSNGESPVNLRAPNEPGSYEIRYVLGQTHRILASVPIRVE